MYSGFWSEGGKDHDSIVLEGGTEFHIEIENKNELSGYLFSQQGTSERVVLCHEKYHCEYLLTQKDTRQRKLDEGFEWIKSGEDAMRKTGLCKEKGTSFYANHVEELAGKTEVMNVFEYEYENKDKEGNIQTIRFQWISSLELSNRNLEEMILAGRGRWKIENEGFNKWD